VTTTVTRLASLLALAALGLSGCGSSGGSSVVSQTGSNVAKIKSGVLDLRLLVTPHDGGAPFGFELKGPFSLDSGKLPVARITYTQMANGNKASATFVSNGARAWIVSDAGTRRLTTGQAQALRMSETLSGLDIGGWVKDAKVTDGPAGTDLVRGKVDVVAAANGLSGVAALAGKGVPSIEGADAKRLEEATRSSTVELISTKDDHLLRRLSMRADLGFDVPQTLRAALGSRVGARVDFRLAIAKPNSHVVVTGP
jgi:hypothetical protein